MVVDVREAHDTCQGLEGRVVASPQRVPCCLLHSSDPQGFSTTLLCLLSNFSAAYYTFDAAILREAHKTRPSAVHKSQFQSLTMLGPGTGMLGEDGIHVDMNHLKSGEVNLGTSIMAINFKDGVILGADSRTTTGAYIANRVTDKLTQVHDTIWCCRSGSAADTQAVADIVQYHLGMYGIMNNEPPTTQTAAALFQELCYDNKDQLR